MTEELKPCPKCGNEDLFFILEEYRENPERTYAQYWKDTMKDYKDNAISLCESCG